MTSTQFQEIMRHMGCINGEKFSEIFGEENAEYLCEKFFVEFNRNVRTFICYLDSNNMRRLWAYLMLYIEQNHIH